MPGRGDLYSARTETETESLRSDNSGVSGASEDDDESLIARRVERLASSLQDTGKNLRNMSGMLEDIKERDNDRGAAIDQLRDELRRSTDQLRRERGKSGDLKYSPVARAGRASSLVRRQSLSPPRRAAARERSSVRFNRSVSPSRLSRRRTKRLDYDSPSLGYDSGDDVISRTADQETKQLLQELIENQNALIQCQNSAPAAVPSTRQEVERIAQLEKMLNQLQQEVRSSKSRKGYDNTDLSDELRKELLGHHQPQIRSPSASHDLDGDSTADKSMRRKLVRSESAIVELEKQLDEAYRRVESAELGKNDLMRQQAELRDQLSRAEEEKSQLKNKINDYTSEIQREVSRREDSFASEKRSLEEELRKVRAQLNDPKRTIELETARADLDRAEKMKATLASKVESLQKSLQEREMGATEQTYKVKELSHKLEDSDRVKKKAIARVDDLTREVNVLKIDREKMVEQLRHLETGHSGLGKEKEELLTKSRATINALKAKLQRATQELEKEQCENRNKKERINMLEREVEAGRITATAAAAAKEQPQANDNAQIAAIHREIHDLVVLRADQEDLMRRKNEEIHELKVSNSDLERKFSAARDDLDKLEEEITVNRKRMIELETQCDSQEDELIKLRADSSFTQEELNRTSAKADELSRQVNELEARLQEEVKGREELKAALISTEKKERMAREEIASLLNRFNEQEDNHTRVVNELKTDIQELVDVEQRNVQEMVKNMKRERCQLEGEIATLRSEVSEEKASMRGLRAELESTGRQLADTQAELSTKTELEAKLTQRVDSLQHEIHIKDNLAHELESRGKKLERVARIAKDKLKKGDQDMFAVMSTIGQHVDAMVDAVASDGGVSRGSFNHMKTSASSDPLAWLSEMKAKLQWLCGEVETLFSHERDVQTQLKRTQTDILTLLNNSNNDKSFFLDQLDRHQRAINHVNYHKDETHAGVMDQESRLLTLHHNVEDLSHRMQMEAEKDKNDLEDKLSKYNFSGGNRRDYGSYKTGGQQGDSARTDCSESTITPEPSVVRYDPTEHPNTSPRFIHTPPTNLRLTTTSLQTSGGSEHSMSRPTPSMSNGVPSLSVNAPMNMSDEEFRNRFIPKAPPAIPLQAERDDYFN